MTINLNFNVEAWVKQLSIEASSEKDAVDKLMGMTLAEIIAEGAIINSDIKITDIDTDIASYSVVAQVSEIEYDLDPEIMDVNVIEYLKNLLPKTLKVVLDDVTDPDEIEDLIKDAIFYETNYDTESFKFQILETK
jgi:hypothetical protein